jgi:hypothetical protein
LILLLERSHNRLGLVFYANNKGSGGRCAVVAGRVAYIWSYVIYFASFGDRDLVILILDRERPLEDIDQLMAVRMHVPRQCLAWRKLDGKEDRLLRSDWRKVGLEYLPRRWHTLGRCRWALC